jgi:hypothetical protein
LAYTPLVARHNRGGAEQHEGAPTVAAACSGLTSPKTPLGAEPSLPPNEMLRGVNQVLQP